MLSHTDLKKGTYVTQDGNPCVILEHSLMFKGRGSSVMQTKIRNLRTGNIMNKTFHAGEGAEEADIDHMQAVSIYERKGVYTFAQEGNPKNRFELSQEQIGTQSQFLVPNTVVDGLVFESNVISITLPIKMILKVQDSPPGLKGDRAQGGTKTATLETGAIVQVPLFVETGDMIELNTETGEYARRVQE
ncbi:MAG: elongation factor P [bacterium]|nr:elongation factor P [bacterium]